MSPPVVEVSTDVARLDVDLVHRWLSEDAYWALGRSRETVEQAIAASLNFGAYDDGALVGYARVVTDRATFAWICDVYVDRPARGRGVGVALVAAVHEALSDFGVGRAMLATDDALALAANRQLWLHEPSSLVARTVNFGCAKPQACTSYVVGVGAPGRVTSPRPVRGT